MSVILETRLSKQEIFTLYANQIYLGQQSGVSIYGVGEAANAYFGKDVSQLTLPEAAFIAGIIRSPNRYNPYKNLEKRHRTPQPGTRIDARGRRDHARATATAVSQEPIELKQISNTKTCRECRISRSTRSRNCRSSSATLRLCSICGSTRRSIPTCSGSRTRRSTNGSTTLDNIFPKREGT